MAAEAPNSYKDPYWAGLAGSVEDKLALPKGLLTAIITRGERSNADQVSEANAKTPFQIIPATRKAAIDKWGIDPYLSPENAAEVGGLLLKDSLDRNKGDVKMAVAEYHGGTDRANWGPRTRSYVQRVTGAPLDAAAEPTAPATAPSAVADAPSFAAPAQSTFDRISAQMAKPTPAAIANVYAAYQSGQMPAQDAKQFEADVQAGHILLPRGAALKAPPAPEEGAAPGETPAAPAPVQGRGVLPAAVMDAYHSGKMPTADRIQLEHDVEAGLVQVPQGTTLNKMQAPGIVDRVKESITGTQRSTPEIEALPDWTRLPEFAGLQAGADGAPQYSELQRLAIQAGTAMAGPDEVAKIIQANAPGVQIRKDEKGNLIFRSSLDGGEYAYKPGFRWSDVPRAGLAAAAFTPAGRAATIPGAALAAGGTQAVIEGTQAASGGSFDPKEVLLAAATGGAVPAVVNTVRAVAQPAQQLLSKVRGVPEPVAPAEATAAAAAPTVPAVPPGAPAAAVPAVPAAQMTGTELAQTAKSAAEGGIGSSRATRVLAEQAAPDAKTVEAAKRLGIDEYLQPDHVTTNQAYRELAQAVKSVPGSEARAAELQGLDKVAQRADKLIDEIGGTGDISALDATVKGRLQQTQAELEAKANKLYGDLRDAIPAKTDAPARNVVAFVEQRAKDLGGAENLSPMEKQILAKLAPKGGGDVFESLSPAAKRQAIERGAVRQPTYTLLDDVRKDLGAAARQAGPFKDADTGLAKKLYSLLSDDQAAVVERLGMSDTYNAARQAVAVRKGIEDDLASLFGRNIDGSIVGNLSGAVKALPQGDASKLIKLLQSIPPELRENVVASGLSTAFGKNARNGSINFNSYSNWYEGLTRNKQAYAAVMSNLPAPARKQLSDLYRVARGVSSATRERITTGRIQAVQQELQGADTLMANLYGIAKRSAGGLAAEAITAPIGLPGAGISAGIASALAKGKPNALKAADALIASPEFVQMTKAGGNQAAKASAFAYSKPFTRFVRALGQPRELSNRERWVMQALQAQNQQRQ